MESLATRKAITAEPESIALSIVRAYLRALGGPQNLDITQDIFLTVLRAQLEAFLLLRNRLQQPASPRELAAEAKALTAAGRQIKKLVRMIGSPKDRPLPSVEYLLAQAGRRVVRTIKSKGAEAPTNENGESE